MNRKNRKEKEQNTDVSKQICVHKTQNTLLEFNSFLRMAEPKDFWHLHEDFASDYSRIRAVMVDYSKEDSISVYANLSPEIIKYVYSVYGIMYRNLNSSSKRSFARIKIPTREELQYFPYRGRFATTKEKF